MEVELTENSQFISGRVFLYSSVNGSCTSVIAAIINSYPACESVDTLIGVSSRVVTENRRK